jgi:hypothetical protein
VHDSTENPELEVKSSRGQLGGGFRAVMPKPDTKWTALINRTSPGT